MAQFICQVGKFRVEECWHFALGAYRASALATSIRLQCFSCLASETGLPITMPPLDHPLLLTRTLSPKASSETGPHGDTFLLTEYDMRLTHDEMESIIRHDLHHGYSVHSTSSPVKRLRSGTIVSYNATLLFYSFLKGPQASIGLTKFIQGVLWVADIDNAWVRRFSALPLQIWPPLLRASILPGRSEVKSHSAASTPPSTSSFFTVVLPVVSAADHMLIHEESLQHVLPMEMLRQSMPTTICILGSGYSQGLQKAFSMHQPNLVMTGSSSSDQTPVKLFQYLLDTDDVTRWNRFASDISFVSEQYGSVLFQFYMFCLESNKVTFAHHVRHVLSTHPSQCKLVGWNQTDIGRFAKHFLLDMSHDCGDCSRFVDAMLMTAGHAREKWCASTFLQKNRAKIRPMTWRYFAAL